VAHGAVGGLDDEGFLPLLAPLLLAVVLELGVLGGEDPGLGDEAVLLRLALDHPARKKAAKQTCKQREKQRERERDRQVSRQTRILWFHSRVALVAWR